MIKIKELILLKEVIDDLNDGKHFYDQKARGVGDYFWDSIIADIESLFIYAGIHPRIFNLHRMLSKRFPYSVYYEVDSDIAKVIAVLPMRQNPKTLKKQLKIRA